MDDDELPQLDAFRSDVPGPSPEATARIEAAIRARTGVDVGASSERSAAAHPGAPAAGDTPPAAPTDRPAPVDAPLLDLTDPAPPAPTRGGSRRVFLGVAAAAAVVVLVAAIALRPGGGSDEQPTLADLADRAAASDDRPLGDGEYQWSLVIRTENGTTLRTEEWIAADDSGRSVSTRLAPDGTAVGEPRETTAAPGQLVLLPFPYRDLRAAPTTAAALRDAMVELAAGEQGPDLLGEWTAGVLAWDVTPPAVRVAALDLLIDLGYEPIGEVTDPTGRRGWGYAIEVGGTSYVVVLDPATGRSMAFAATTDDPHDLRGATLARTWRDAAVRADTGA